ncbi:hypothetical protein B0H12DRAFT_1067859 [Mycena haematopus]|nr:hypothetical protein B0H12DRAFT_1067859 [Mycena haematopus]
MPGRGYKLQAMTMSELVSERGRSTYNPEISLLNPSACGEQVLFHFIQFVWSQVTPPKIYQIFPEACRALPRVADGSNSQMGTAYESMCEEMQIELGLVRLQGRVGL